jgi:hypothetical protein
MPDAWAFIKRDDGYCFIIGSDGWEIPDEDGEEGNWNEKSCMQPSAANSDTGAVMVMRSPDAGDFLLFKLEKAEANKTDDAPVLTAESPIKLFIVESEKGVREYQGKDTKVISVKIGLRNESDKKISGFHDVTMYIDGYFEGGGGKFRDKTPMSVLWSLNYSDNDNELSAGAEDYKRIAIVVGEHYKGFNDMSDERKDEVFENLEYELTGVTMAYSYKNENGQTITVTVPEAETETASVDFPVTGDGWTNYTEFADDSGTITLGEGAAEIQMEPDKDNKNEYMINLRSITLTFAGETGN